MRLKSLQIDSFKNYGKLSVDFDEQKLHILVGKNGQGKTNFLEAIVLLALSRNYHSASLKDCVNWELDEEKSGLPEYFTIRGELIDSHGELTNLEIGCGRHQKYPKALKVNGVKVKPYDYIGHLKVVIFTPQDLNMVFLSPIVRRRYVNIFLSQIDPVYLKNLSQYQVIVKHRNKLLVVVKEQPSRASELDYWDEKLAEHGAYLLLKRREIFEEFNRHLSGFYERISSQPVELQLVWKKEWKPSAPEHLQKMFLDYLQEKRTRDIEVGSTCGGPHREDFFFQMNGRDLSEFGSRGECRSAVLAMKLAECSFIKNLTNDSPLVLFDDVFSELDTDRQKNLLQLFDAEQVFITTTHLDFDTEGARVWKVEGGMLED